MTAVYESGGCTESDSCLRKRWMYGEWQMFTKAVDVRRKDNWLGNKYLFTEQPPCLRNKCLSTKQPPVYETNACPQNSRHVYETNACPQNSHLFTKQMPVHKTATLFTKQMPVHKTATCLRNKCLSTEQPLHKTNPQKKRRKK